MRKIILILFLFSTTLFGLDLSVIGLRSSFRYAENSSNNKDDLYLITSFGGGVEISQKVSVVELSISSMAQIPTEITIEDAFGASSENYLYGLSYWGVKTVIGVDYPIKLSKGIAIKLGCLVVHDYFSFTALDDGEHFQFGTIGGGLSLGLEIPLTDRFAFNFSFIGETSPVVVSTRDGNSLWSYSFYGTTGFTYFFKENL